MTSTTSLPLSNKEISGYVFDFKLGVAPRIASFLHWAARTFPGRYTPMTVLTKAVKGGSRLPSIDSDQCLEVRKGVGRARQILLRQYNRGMHIVRNIGVRASCNEDEKVLFDTTRKSRRARKAIIALKESHDSVDTSALKLPTTQAFMKNLRENSKIFKPSLLNSLEPSKDLFLLPAPESKKPK